MNDIANVGSDTVELDKLGNDSTKTPEATPDHTFDRTSMLLGVETVEDLKSKHVAVFGIGGVGGYVCEALVRSGIGKFTLVDKDTVDETNINRQIIATRESVGRPKTTVMAERMRSINPSVQVIEKTMFFLPENADRFDFTDYDYVVDAVDTVTAKLSVIMKAKEAGVPVISSMGAGNKLHPEAFTVADIYETSVCPLAKVMRRELRKRGVKELTVVYSKEVPLTPIAPKDNIRESDGGCKGTIDSVTPTENTLESKSGCKESFEASEARKENTPRPPVKRAPGSVAFVPGAAGLIIAGVVIRELGSI